MLVWYDNNNIII